VLERREFLLSQSALAGAAVEVRSVSLSADPMAGMPVDVTVRLGANAGRAESVLLHHASGAPARFASVPMYDDGGHGDGKAGDGTYGATIPAVSGGTRLRYYVEVRSLKSLGSASFYPSGAEQGALERYVPPRRAASTPVAINELMARNSRSVRDPQREFDDWLEIYNLTGSAVDLSGMYLTDKEEQPRKWRVPQGAVIQPFGFLVIWADEDVEAGEGLHAGFRLSASGETLTLVDVDARGNQILDSVRFGPQEQDVAIGRYPDGTGDFARVRATPGKRNAP
jgi:hypothetical protein